MTETHSPIKGPPRVIVLSQGTDERAHSLIDDPSSPYRTLSDLVEAALRNHYELGGAGYLHYTSGEPVHASAPTLSAASVTEVAQDARVAVEGRIEHVRKQPKPAPASVPTATPEPMTKITVIPVSAIAGANEAVESVIPNDTGYMSFLVNRLNPVPPICRSLARCAPQTYEGLLDAIGEPARIVGFQLRNDDAAKKRPMSERLATSWPIGDDPDKSISKFISSYIGDPTHPGALVQLGLAEWDEYDELLLTPLGAELAKCDSPIVDNVADKFGRMSHEAIQIVIDAIRSNPAEREMMATFIDLVLKHDGKQSLVDDELASVKGWNHDTAVSMRAAIVGRLRDLNILEVTGRGSTARISIVVENPFMFKD